MSHMPETAHRLVARFHHLVLKCHFVWMPAKSVSYVISQSTCVWLPFLAHNFCYSSPYSNLVALPSRNGTQQHKDDHNHTAHIYTQQHKVWFLVCPDCLLPVALVFNLMHRSIYLSFPPTLSVPTVDWLNQILQSKRCDKPSGNLSSKFWEKSGPIENVVSRITHHRDESPWIHMGARRGWLPWVLLSECTGAEDRNYYDGQSNPHTVFEDVAFNKASKS
jgi:hypothetical protein